MKLFSFIVFAFFFSSYLQAANAQYYQQICDFCTGKLEIPSNWPECQQLLKIVCSWLITAPKECAAIVDVADMSRSYDKAYPYILQLKDNACDKFKGFC